MFILLLSCDKINLVGDKINDLLRGVFSESDVNTTEVFKTCGMRERAEQHAVRVNIKAAKCFPRSLQFIAATCDDKFIRFTLMAKRKKILIERPDQKSSRQ